MATVTSLTDTKIKEMMAGWEVVGLSQEEINSLVGQLKGNVESQEAVLIEFNEVVLPLLKDELDTATIAMDELADLIPELERNLAQARSEIDDIRVVTMPALQEDVGNTITNLNERPKVYVQDEAPDDPDIDDRVLVVGDVWFDTANNKRQRIWNGVEWTTFEVDIPDLSLTVKKFKVLTHAIY